MCQEAVKLKRSATIIPSTYAGFHGIDCLIVSDTGQPLLAHLHEEMVTTGAFNLKGIKSRAIKHTQYRIADGDPGYAFVHVGLSIREGCPLEVQKDAS